MSIFSSFFGGGPRQPRTQQVVQQTKLPEEIAPFAKEVLEDAKKQYLESMERGYDPYTGQTIAPQTQEQLEAQEGLKALVGTQRPMQEEALAQFRTGLTESFTPEVAQEYMSPYQRAVTDIEKREAQRTFESQIMPQFEKQAVQAGGMSGLGTRAGVQASELGRAQMQRLGDIEAKGLQAAYRDAQNLFQQQQARERTAAADIAGLAPAMVAGGVTEQGLLQSIGEEKQQLGQQALNEAYYKYLEEQAFPQEQLAGYSGFVYGNPLMSQRTMTTTSPAAMGPSKGSQLMGLGMTAAKMYGMGGGFGNAPGGFSLGNIFKKEGGGLSSLPVVYKQDGESIYAGLAAMEGPYMRKTETSEVVEDWEDTDQAKRARAAMIKKRKDAERLAETKSDTPPSPRTHRSEAEDLLAARRKAVEGRQAYSPEEWQRRERKDADELQALFTRRAGERKTATQAYQDRMEEARKRTFEAQRGLVPTGHAGYERAMRSLLRGTAAGAPQRGLLESFLGAGTEMIGGIREGEAAKQKALAEIEQRRGTAEMGDIKDYQTMEAADQAAAFKSELTMIKDVNPKLWKSIQDRLDKNAKAGMDEATSIASIMESFAQRDLQLAKAGEAGKTGVTIKAADYNAAGTMFDRMIDMAKFDGPRDSEGRIKTVTMIGKRAIRPEESAKLRKILAGAMRMVRDGDMSQATDLVEKEIDKMLNPKKQTPKYKKGDKIQIRHEGKLKWVVNTGEKGNKEWKDVDEK